MEEIVDSTPAEVVPEAKVIESSAPPEPPETSDKPLSELTPEDLERDRRYKKYACGIALVNMEMLKSFTPEQLRRYELVRRSRFSPIAIKNVIEKRLKDYPDIKSHVDKRALIVMGGISKVFVGEVVENARLVMEEGAEAGPIHPRHIREALRRLARDGNRIMHRSTLRRKEPNILLR